MTPREKKKETEVSAKGRREVERGLGLKLAAIGMESEFVVLLNDQQVKPEDVFRDPRSFVRGPLIHRVGTSYHLPTGSAVYFDTGVIEIATPIIEIERGCAARAGRSLWESILFVREEIDAWEQKHGKDVRLAGFSSHYNISFDVPAYQQGRSRTVEKLAFLLARILPAPVMLLATNKRSTGVGVRPRGDRIEITLDFTPSAALMIATGAFITGVVREVMKWPSFELDMLDQARLPVMVDLRPIPHTSRSGWLARYDCYPQNPFQISPDAPVWRVRTGASGSPRELHELLSLREVASRVFKYFRIGIRRIAEPFTYRMISGVLNGTIPSLLDLPDRPPEYEDVGRLCVWDNLFPERELSRSRYERILIRAISGKKLWLDGSRYTPVGLRGWSEVVFRRDADDSRHVYSIDYLLDHLERWG